MNCNRSIGISLGLSLLLMTGCSGVTTVQSVREHPHRNWFTSTVYLQGKVSKQAPLLKGQLYELEDNTGKIWVLSSAEPGKGRRFKPGQQIRIKGKVRYEAIDIAGQNLGEAYIEEQQRLEPK